jgi:hypothetical protein
MQKPHQLVEPPDRLWHKGFRDAATVGMGRRLAGLTDSYKLRFIERTRKRRWMRLFI